MLPFIPSDVLRVQSLELATALHMFGHALSRPPVLLAQKVEGDRVESYVFDFVRTADAESFVKDWQSMSTEHAGFLSLFSSLLADMREKCEKNCERVALVRRGNDVAVISQGLDTTVRKQILSTFTN